VSPRAQLVFLFNLVLVHLSYPEKEQLNELVIVCFCAVFFMVSEAVHQIYYAQ